ncbi:Variant surface glycoprotein [Trypanosoma congolense IL3000]|uniref:Variant surface glycoprotein n=1 Tax=Trypanosoma congolense (strain IL3000) TaxID=1068625 RepID=F9WC76_TRYCI|nr:Variant surface glycoprotein [Trypanosoma congolense IL3000]
MKMWRVVIVLIGAGAKSAITNHNGEHHATLCELLRAATRLWNATREHLHKDLQDALKHVIFGEVSEASAVNFTLPDAYGNSREKRRNWCGTRSPIENLWPGYSAPYDLVCLFTIGMRLAPFLERNLADTLCGAYRADLGCGRSRLGGRIWNERRGYGYQPNFLLATWTNVEVTARGEMLLPLTKVTLSKKWKIKQKLQKFTEILTTTGGFSGGTKYILGGSNFNNYQCSGERAEHACVEYPYCCRVFDKKLVHKNQTSWWKRLNKTLKRTTSELIVRATTIQSSSENPQSSTESSTSSPQDTNVPKPRTSRSTPGDPSETNTTESNPTAQPGRLNITSSMPITPLRSWLLAALFL